MQNAVAEGDTRTISMHHVHTDEDITITYKRDGRYDEAALEKLNWFLRDWRRSEATTHGPAPYRSGLGGAARSGNEGADLRSFAATVRHRPTPCCATAAAAWRVSVSTCSATPWTSTFRVCRSQSFALSDCACTRRRRLLSNFGLAVRPHGHRRRPDVAAHDARGTGARVSRMAAPFIFRPTAGRCQAMRWRSPISASAATLSPPRTRSRRRSGAGIDVSGVVASNEHHVNPFAKLLGLAKDEDDEDGDAHAATAVASAIPAPAATTRSHIKQTVVAALERGVEKVETIGKKITAPTVSVQALAAAAPPKLIQVAGLAGVPAPDAAASVAAPPSPNQVISARGYWNGPPDGMPVAQSTAHAANPLSTLPAPPRPQTASTETDATGALAPWSSADDNHVPAQLALAYARQPTCSSLANTGRPDGNGIDTDARQSKRVDDRGDSDGRQDQSVIHCRASTGVRSIAARVGDPFATIRGCAPSFCRRACAASSPRLALGARDFRSLAALMVQARQFGDDDVRGRPQSRPGSGSLQRQRDRVRVDGDLPDPHRVAALIAVIARSNATSNPASPQHWIFAEPVIGPAASGRTRWLPMAYHPACRARAGRSPESPPAPCAR